MNPNKPIRSIMTTLLTSVSATTKIKDIQDIFSKNEFHHLPVVEDGLKLVGIISRKDFEKFNYLMSMKTTGKTWTTKSMASLCANDIMTKSVVSLDPDDSIGLAADIFLANKFHSIPVVEDDILKGIVTTYDLLKYSFDSPVEVCDNEDY